MMPALDFAATFAALYAAHQVADHWIQTSTQAADKGRPDWRGRLACARHVASYTATGVVALAAVDWRCSLHLSVLRVAAGLAVSAASHYYADRRTPLKNLAARFGLLPFYVLGAPRHGRDDLPSLGTGAYALDQSWHVGWLFIAALVIA